MKVHRIVYCIVPMIASLPFLVVGIIGVKHLGPHPLAIGFGLIGLFSLAVGIYYSTWRIEYRGEKFVVYPGKKEYRICDIVWWKMHEDKDVQPGYRRHLELRFDCWYRRYLLLEENISSAAFDALLKSLENGNKHAAANEH